MNTDNCQLLADVLRWVAAEERKLPTASKKQRRIRRAILADLTEWAAAQIVACNQCGAETLRLPDHSDAGRTCFTWHMPDRSYADTCPGCGRATSLLTTSPRRDGHEA